MDPYKPPSDFVCYSNLYKDVYDRALLSKLDRADEVPVLHLPPKPELIQVRSIGMGAASSVYLVSETHTRCIYAMKIVSKNTAQKQKEFLQEEVRIHSSLDHPNIISLYHIFSDEGSLKLVLEYADRSLMAELKRKGVFSEREASLLIAQILSALEYIHDKGITHRDIKLENVLLVNETAKICDFGLAKKQKVFESSDLVGTIDYLSPEIVKDKRYTHKTDIWAVGVVLWELINGASTFLKAPKQADKYLQLIQFDAQSLVYGSCSQGLRAFFGKIFTREDSRAEARDLLRERFIVQHQQKGSAILERVI